MSKNSQEVVDIAEEVVGAASHEGSQRFSRNQRRQKSREPHATNIEIVSKAEAAEVQEVLNQSVNTVEGSDKSESGEVEAAGAVGPSKDSSPVQSANSSKKRKLKDMNQEDEALPVQASSDANVPENSSLAENPLLKSSVSDTSSCKRRKLNSQEDDQKVEIASQSSKVLNDSQPIESKYLNQVEESKASSPMKTDDMPVPPSAIASSEDQVAVPHQTCSSQDDALNLQSLSDALPPSSVEAQQHSQSQQPPLSQGQLMAEVVALQTVIPCIEEALVATSTSQQQQAISAEVVNNPVTSLSLQDQPPGAAQTMPEAILEATGGSATHTLQEEQEEVMAEPLAGEAVVTTTGLLETSVDQEGATGASIEQQHKMAEDLGQSEQ